MFKGFLSKIILLTVLIAAVTFFVMYSNGYFSAETWLEKSRELDSLEQVKAEESRLDSLQQLELEHAYDTAAVEEIKQ